MGRTINTDVRSGCVPERALERPGHIQVRWLWIQHATRDKVVHLRKVKGTDSEADIGTKDLDGPTHQRLLQKLPLKPTLCRRLLGLIATANGGSVVEARMSGNGNVGEVFSTSDDCDTNSIGDVGPDGCTTSEETARSNSSGKDC